MLTSFPIQRGPSIAEIRDALFNREHGIRRLTFVTDDPGIKISAGIEAGEVMPGETQIWTLGGEATLITEGALGLRRECVIYYDANKRRGVVTFTSFIRQHPEEKPSNRHPHRQRHYPKQKRKPRRSS